MTIETVADPESKHAQGEKHQPHAPTQRLLLFLWVWLPALSITAMCLYWHAARPFQTQHQFVNLVRTGQFDKAKSMIEPADLRTIPEAYWEQFREFPPESLIAPTPLTLINGRMAMKLALLGDAGQRNRQTIDIRFEVDGRRIHVREIRGNVVR